MIDLNQPWILLTGGILFCLSGILLLRKNIFEEGRSITWPVLIMIMGVVLITLGSARGL